nr:MAG TPA: putative excisionase [Caudoviricetes sp.]
MTKTEVKKQLSRDLEGNERLLLNIKDAAKLLNMSVNTLKPMLVGVDYMPVGREKRYFIGDIADVIVSRKKITL